MSNGTNNGVFQLIYTNILFHTKVEILELMECSCRIPPTPIKLTLKLWMLIIFWIHNLISFKSVNWALVFGPHQIVGKNLSIPTFSPWVATYKITTDSWNEHFLPSVKPRERELSFSKLDLPLFQGPFLSILPQNIARVGGWVFNSSQVYHSPHHRTHHCIYVFGAKCYVICSNLRLQ